ncbi:phosphoribosyl-AMP cyclohydrolase [Candidatus Gottesmanbacteria bacterium RIFCSPLOWO2_01_FULL_39_12b]|uniref:Histidine biosynthesis bifunctional protein HisIE n=1 Tax=Candidatus Gottesmanbacteria bacterium RIFCSPLOWO2_01_FULL_39_12b TaxID=1798388 RepID=A0A1F6ARN4_9BACT|nr:MAG: phosphoribosyl-AMP cyclohydrolase [Candidatus Gottesmanbacteria bacterium RIFCSPLOWO2_01_FULL_39_12b]
MKNIKIDFKKLNGLVPVIIQDDKTGDVLMLGFMNQPSYQKTVKEGLVYFWSRKRKKLWLKGETSGNKLKVKKIFLDCDFDALLIKIDVSEKSVCHTGRKSCFVPLS